MLIDGKWYAVCEVVLAVRLYERQQAAEAIMVEQALRAQSRSRAPIHGACGRRMRANDARTRWACNPCAFSVSMNADELRAFERKTVLRPVPAEKPSRVRKPNPFVFWATHRDSPVQRAYARMVGTLNEVATLSNFDGQVRLGHELHELTGEIEKLETDPTPAVEEVEAHAHCSHCGKGVRRAFVNTCENCLRDFCNDCVEIVGSDTKCLTVLCEKCREEKKPAAEKSRLRPLLEMALDQINAYAFGPNEKVGPALSNLAGEIDRVDKLLENQK